MIAFDSDFEGGSLDRAIKMGENWYHLKLRPDTWYYFSCRIRGCEGKNIIFEITCGDNCDPIYRNGKGRWYRDSCLHRPVISYDRKTWERVAGTEREPVLGEGTYRFSHTFAEDEAYIAYAEPYLYSDLVSWLHTIEGDPMVEIGTTGNSRNGISQPLVTITANKESRDLVLLICREDADEFVANFSLEGIVRSLLQNRQEELLNRCTFKIVPMVSVDGVIAGTTYGAGCACLTAPAWGANPSPPEIENLKRAIHHWIDDDKYNLILAGKLHSIQCFTDVEVVSPIVLRNWDGKKRYGDGETADPLLREFLLKTTDDWWSPTRVGLRLESGGSNFEMYLVRRFHFLSTFAAHTAGDNAEDARRCGEGLLKAMTAFIEHKHGMLQ